MKSSSLSPFAPAEYTGAGLFVTHKLPKAFGISKYIPTHSQKRIQKTSRNIRLPMLPIYHERYRFLHIHKGGCRIVYPHGNAKMIYGTRIVYDFN